MEKLIQEVIKNANVECFSDDEDFNVMDHCGGNYDDAYSIGVGDGWVEFARYLSKKIDEYNLEITNKEAENTILNAQQNDEL